MPSSAHSISIPASGDRSFGLQGIPRRRGVARLACRGQSGAGQPPERSKRPETLACTVGLHGAAAKRLQRHLQDTLAFGTAPHPARHSATLACDAGRRVMTSADLSGLRKVTGGNGGNGANLIFFRDRPRHAVKWGSGQNGSGQKGSAKCGNPLRCRFYRCFFSAVAGYLPLAETGGKSSWAPRHR